MANLTLDEYTAAQRKIYDAYATDEIKKKQAAVDNSVAAVKAQGEKDIESTKASYEDEFRKNNLNQIINEEKVKERMANLGLTDSGLNRSQQTAIQLQRSNADAATIRNRQAAVDEIRKGIADYVTAAEAKKVDIDSTVRSNWMQKADANAVALYNQQEANNAAIRAAKIKALEKLIEKNTEANNERKTAFEDLMKAYIGNSLTNLDRNNLREDFVRSYGELTNDEKTALDNRLETLKKQDIRLRTFEKSKDTLNGTSNIWKGFGLFGGGDKTVDLNDKVKDEFENEYTLKQLRDTYGFTNEELMKLTRLRDDDGSKLLTEMV